MQKARALATFNHVISHLFIITFLGTLYLRLASPPNNYEYNWCEPRAAIAGLASQLYICMKRSCSTIESNHNAVFSAIAELPFNAKDMLLGNNYLDCGPFNCIAAERGLFVQCLADN